jgi:hypothetical protein
MPLAVFGREGRGSRTPEVRRPSRAPAIAIFRGKDDGGE